MYRIAVISVSWTDEYIKKVLAGVKEVMQDTPMRVDVFNAFAADENGVYQRLEYTIFDLARANNYDALMFLHSGLSNVRGRARAAVEDFQKAGKPVITLDMEFMGIPFMGIDNYHSEYEMVEHLIKEHNCKTFQFIGGPEGNGENKERFRAFCDAINDNGLTVDDRYVSFNHFVEVDGVDVYTANKAAGLEIPDAVVCANDNMARGFLKAATDDGKKAPDDFLLVGFDNIESCQKNIPSITSVNRNWVDLGKEAAELIVRMINGEKAPAKTTIKGFIRRNQSCGCDRNRDLEKEYYSVLKRLDVINEMDIAQSAVRQTLCCANSFDELMVAGKKCRGQKNFPEMAIFINDAFPDVIDFDSTAPVFSNEMTLVTNDFVTKIYEEDGIIPKEWVKSDETGMYLFSALHYNEHSQGYVVSEYDEKYYSQIYYGAFCESVMLAVENISRRMALDDMNQTLKKLYVLDSLTGLYNRFGYSSLAGKMFSENSGKVYIIFVDIDGLKKMNDVYGHDMGDELIKGMAICLRRVFTGDEVLVRMGGDEFLVMGAFVSEEEIIKSENELRDTMKKYSEEKKLPLPLEASLGHSFNVETVRETELTKLLNNADKCMYENKQLRKKGRK